LHIDDRHRVVPPIIAGKGDRDRNDHAPHPATRKSHWERSLDQDAGDAQERANGDYVENAEHGIEHPPLKRITK
jgi:hypothetical protein